MLEAGTRVPDVLVWTSPREEAQPLRTVLGTGLTLLCFYEGRKGKYANRLEALTNRARAKYLGLWGACPHTPYDPHRGIETRR